MLRRIPAVPEKIRHLLSLLIILGAVLAVFGVAAALDELQFSPGINYAPAPVFEGAPGGPGFTMPYGIFQAFLVIMGILLIISSLVLIRSKEHRKKAARNLFLIVIYMLAFIIFASRSKPREQPEEPPATTEEAPYNVPIAPGSDEPAPPAVELEPPQVTGWLGYVVSLAIIVMVGGLGYYYYLKSRPSNLELKEITRAALADLESGRTWDDVVIQCYAQMSSAVTRTGHLYRPPAMTPAEFSRRLEMAGMPVQPVRSLTRLFEVARYGGRHSTVTEAASAKACLTSILQSLEQREE